MLDTADLAPGVLRRGGPEPEGPVDVHPRALVVPPGDERFERITRAAVDVPRLQTDDRRGVQRRERPRDDAALGVDREHRRSVTSEADEAK